MELALAILVAGPAGYLTRRRRRGLVTYLALWAAVFPIQTIVVYATSDDGSAVPYVLFNAAILAGGVGLNLLGSALRERRRDRRAIAGAA